MKKINSYLAIFIVFIIFVTITITVSIFFAFNHFVSSYLVFVLLLLITWLLYKKEGKNLSELGLQATGRTISFIPLGILVGILFYCFLFLIQMLYSGFWVEMNKNVEYLSLFIGIFFLLPDVLIEELIFRGYCFKKTVNKAGIIKANIIFAFLFIVWHWFALDAWGNYGFMLALFTTGFGHVLFSTALASSRTLYFPIGIHLGNNWVSRYIFSNETKGMLDTKLSNDSLFFIVSTNPHPSQFHIVTSYLITIAWMLLSIFIIWRLKKRFFIYEK